jgi:hypothetical protein
MSPTEKWRSFSIVASVIALLLSMPRAASSDEDDCPCTATPVGGQGTVVCFESASSSTSVSPGNCENSSLHCPAKPCKLTYSFDIQLDPECEGPGLTLCTGVCQNPAAHQPGANQNPLDPCFGPDNCSDPPTNHLTGGGVLNARCGQNATVYVNQAGSAVFWAILICQAC